MGVEDGVAIAMRLDDMEPPARVDGESHGILEQRFGGEEFKPEAGCELESLDVLLDRVGRRMTVGGVKNHTRGHQNGQNKEGTHAGE